MRRKRNSSSPETKARNNETAYASNCGLNASLTSTTHHRSQAERRREYGILDSFSSVKRRVMRGLSVGAAMIKVSADYSISTERDVGRQAAPSSGEAAPTAKSAENAMSP